MGARQQLDLEQEGMQQARQDHGLSRFNGAPGLCRVIPENIQRFGRGRTYQSLGTGRPASTKAYTRAQGECASVLQAPEKL